MKHQDLSGLHLNRRQLAADIQPYLFLIRTKLRKGQAVSGVDFVKAIKETYCMNNARNKFVVEFIERMQLLSINQERNGSTFLHF